MKTIRIGDCVVVPDKLAAASLGSDLSEHYVTLIVLPVMSGQWVEVARFKSYGESRPGIAKEMAASWVNAIDVAIQGSERSSVPEPPGMWD